MSFLAQDEDPADVALRAFAPDQADKNSRGENIIIIIIHFFIL